MSIAAPGLSTPRLFGNRYGSVGPAGYHVDVMGFDDQASVGVFLLLGHDLVKLGVVVSRFQPLVTLFFGRITANVNERILGANTQFRIALNRDPVSYVRDSMPGVNSSGTARKTAGQRIALTGKCRIYPQFKEASRFPLLSQAPA